jgi:hypothetical protein
MRNYISYSYTATYQKRSSLREVRFSEPLGTGSRDYVNITFATLCTYVYRYTYVTRNHSVRVAVCSVRMYRKLIKRVLTFLVRAQLQHPRYRDAIALCCRISKIIITSSTAVFGSCDWGLELALRILAFLFYWN